MKALTSMSDFATLMASLAFIVGFASLAAFLLIRYLPVGSRAGAGTTAHAYMTAFGSLFAFLTGFLINSEYAYLKAAQNSVGQEVAAATQLASASSTLPPPDAERIQDRMRVYLSSLPTAEWNALALDKPTSSPSGIYMGELQQQVFSLSNREYPSTSALTAMEDAIAQMTQARRERIVISSGSLPLPLFALSLFAGMALIVNAIFVALKSGARFVFVASGLVLIVALAIAAVLAVSAPFRGPFVTKASPVIELVQELQAGRFTPWVQER